MSFDSAKKSYLISFTVKWTCFGTLRAMTILRFTFAMGLCTFHSSNTPGAKKQMVNRIIFCMDGPIVALACSILEYLHHILALPCKYKNLFLIDHAFPGLMTSGYQLTRCLLPRPSGCATSARRPKPASGAHSSGPAASTVPTITGERGKTAAAAVRSPLCCRLRLLPACFRRFISE